MPGTSLHSVQATQCHISTILAAACKNSKTGRVSPPGLQHQVQKALTSRPAPQCRFPDSESSSHFWANLRDGRDMVTLDGRRWPAGLHNTPGRFGKLIEFDRFDASFFSVHGKQAQVRARGWGQALAVRCWVVMCCEAACAESR